MGIHAHTTFSAFDGLGQPIEHLEAARDAGLPGLAITDHGTTSGWYSFEEAAGEVGLNPLFGVEAYYCPDASIKDKDEGFGTRPAHLIILAKNERGLRSINSIITRSYAEGFYVKARCDARMLAENREGIIVTSACVGGPVGKYLESGDHQRARSFIREMVSIFGEDFFLEIQPHDMPEQRALNEFLAKGYYGKVPFVIGNDSHYPRKGDRRDHRILLAASTNTSEDDPVYSYDHDFWVKSLDDTALTAGKNHPYLPKGLLEEATSNVERMLSGIRVSLPKQLTLTPSVGENAIESFRRSVEKGFREIVAREGLSRQERSAYIDRLSYEMRIIEDKGFVDYFLVVSDTIALAKRSGVMVGIGRGSVGGSLVAYCLGITSVDPIKWSLPFERFMPPHRGGYEMTFHGPDEVYEISREGLDRLERRGIEDYRSFLRRACLRSPRMRPEYGERLKREMRHIETQELEPYYLGLWASDEKVDTDSHLVAYLLFRCSGFDPGREPPRMLDLPDIDVDFSDRERVYSILKERYGSECVSYISNYSRFGGKSALRDIAKAMKTPVPNDIQRRVEELDSIGAFLGEAREWDVSPKVMEVLRCAARIEGNIRQTSVTAAGIIVSSEPIVKYSAMAVSTKGSSKGQYVSVYDKRDAEKIGFVKMDILGLTNVATVKEALRLIEERQGLPDHLRGYGIYNLPTDDERVIEEFASGHTDLIFQYGGRAFKPLLKRLKPDCAEDLIALNAITRPGADDEAYIRRKRGEEEVVYPHPDAEPILRSTYGLPIYQEQVMEICRVLAGMSWRDVNRVRKMVSKKDSKEAESLHRIFLSGCKDKGISEEVAGELWSQIMRHGGYSFNRSHAVAYFLAAWANMYLQVYYPFEWILANLRTAKDDEKTFKALFEGHRLGLDMGRIDVNSSGTNWSYSGDRLLHKLSMVPGVGDSAAEAIEEERRRGGPYSSVEDMRERLPKRVFNKRVEDALIRAGAIPGSESDERYDRIFSLIHNGRTFDLTSIFETDPLWNAKDVTEYGSGCEFILGYVRSCKKGSKGDYRVSVHGLWMQDFYYSQRLEPGVYLLCVDTNRYYTIYRAIPVESPLAKRHPLRDIRIPDGRGVRYKRGGLGYFLGGRRAGNGYVCMVLDPNPRVIWASGPPPGEKMGLYYIKVGSMQENKPLYRFDCLLSAGVGRAAG